MNLPRRALALLGLAAAAMALSGCAERAAASPPTSITVAAAASLHPVLPKLAAEFERQHPGATVRLSFGGSSALAAEIVAGAPVDVFAAASDATMRTVTSAHLTAAPPVVIARNRLEIAVPKGDPGHVTGLADFADPARTIVVCARQVPCGAAAQRVFALAHLAAKPDSTAPDVTSVLTAVELGDADAGLVYRTDVRAAAGKVQGIDFPQSVDAVTAYPIAPLKGRAEPLAQAFTRFVVRHGGPELAAAGFLAPR